MVSRATALGASASRREAFRRGGAAAAVIGGTAWFVKAAVIIATGDEPPVAFTIGFALFPFALLGLWSLVRNVEGRSPRIGGAIAVVAAVSVVIALLVRAVGGTAVQPAEDEITVLTPFIVIAGFGTFAALVALGVTVRRAGALTAPYTSLPWTMGLAAIPLLIAAGALETVNERLFELPIALFGLAWIALGAALWSATPRASR